MIVVIPMAGQSSRFFQAGFTRPKYELELGDTSLLAHVLSSFRAHFDDAQFVFIARTDFDAPEFILRTAEECGLRRPVVVTADKPTAGQAASALLGLQGAGVHKSSDELLIFNCDSILRSFELPDWRQEYDGYLEVFRGEGTHWSFAELGADLRTVLRTTEKERISDYCSNGLYWFRSASLFTELAQLIAQQEHEQYVAPLYDLMIRRGDRVGAKIVRLQDMVFAGTPNEYESALAQLQRGDPR